MKRSLLSILYICCITTLCCAAEKVNLKEMYAQLDKAISNAPYYKQQKETHINQQKLSLAKVRNNQQRLSCYLQLYEAYKTYQNDSAIAYLQKGIRLTQTTRHYAEGNNLRALLALQYSTSGAFTEALDILKSISSRNFDENGKKNYYLACFHVYGELGFNNMHIDTDLSRSYFHKQDNYRDTLLAIFPPHSEEYLKRKEMMLSNAAKYKEALNINDERLAKCKDNTHEYGIVAYVTSSNSRKPMSDLLTPLSASAYSSSSLLSRFTISTNKKIW